MFEKYLLILMLIICICMHDILTEELSDKWLDPHDINSYEKYEQFSNELPDKWLDPHDMNSFKEYKQLSNELSAQRIDPHDINSFKKNEKLSNKVLAINQANSKSTNVADLYMKRFINMLLKSVHEDYANMGMFSGHLYFQIDSEKYEKLMNFASNKNEKSDYVEVDKILSSILNKPRHEDLKQYLEHWFHKLLNVLLHRNTTVIFIISLYIHIIYKMYRAKFNYFYVLKYIFINMLIFDFIFTWINLYQIEQAKQVAYKEKQGNNFNTCNPENLTWWQFLLTISSFRQNNCEEFYKIQYEDIFYKISPGTVLIEMFSRTIKYPSKAIGAAVGDIFTGIYDALPYSLKFFLFPVCLLFFCILMCILLSFIFSKSLKFNLFHLISFSFGGETRTSKRNEHLDKLSEYNLEKVLELTYHRHFIEIVKQNNIELLRKEIRDIVNSDKVANSNISEEDKVKVNYNDSKSKKSIEENNELIEDCNIIK